MRQTTTPRLFIACALLGLALAAGAQAPATQANARIAAIEAALRQRPADAALWFYLSRAHAQAGDVAAATAAMEKVAALGEGFLPARRDFEKVWGEPAFQAVRSRLEARLPRLDYAPTAFALTDPQLVPEGIAYDGPSRSTFIGSIAQRKVVRFSARDGASDFAGPEARLDSVLGLAVDAPRRILYVVSTSALGAAKATPARNAVVAFDVDSGRLLQRHDVPEARQLNDVAVAPGGRVFASDSASGAVFEIAVKGPGPARTLVGPGQLVGSNGMAASPDATRLYVAHATGIAMVELATGAARRLVNPTRENIAGIDGLYEWQGQLIGVQNATNPGRVILLSLSPDGTSIREVQTLLSHHHNALDEPTTGAVAGPDFLLLAATGISRHLGESPPLAPGQTAPPPAVVRLPLPR